MINMGKISGVLLAAGLLTGSGAQAAVWTWTNGGGDNVFTNAVNWDNGFPSNETMVVSLSGADRAVLSDGMVTPNMDGIRVSYASGDVGEVEQTGGIMNITAMSGRETVVGHGGGTGTWIMNGGEAYLNNMAVGAGGGTGMLIVSNGVMEFASTYNGASLIVGTESAGSEGTVELAGGIIKTAYGINLGSKAGGASTFHLNGGAGAVSNGVLNGAVSGYWYQDGTSRLKATIDSDDAFSLSQIVIVGGSNDTPSVTFDYGSVIDVSFSGADMGDVTNSWDLITWPSNTVVTDSGLSFDTNVVDLANWSFAITNNALRVTYGIGSEYVVITNPPPSGPRALYWTGNGGGHSATNGPNWDTDQSGTAAAWGIYEGDTVYVGHNYVNESDFVSEVSYDGGAHNSEQSALYIGRGRTGIFSMNSGYLRFLKSTSNLPHYIGFGASTGNGTLNMNGGELWIYGIELGDRSGAQGALNITGGDLVLSGRVWSSGGNGDRGTLWVGSNGSDGSVNISGGSLKTLIGVILGDSGGTGTFTVDGSGASQIGIGAYRSDFDGYWVQHSNSTLNVVIDDTAAGVTPIEIIETGQANTPTLAQYGADVVFEAGSVLDISWASNVVNYGSFDVMKFGGTYIDNGLTLSTNVDTDVWSFAFVDTDGDTTNDTLRVTAYGETELGTSLGWLAEHGLTEADELEDNDGDGLATWEEYIAGTSPVDAGEVLKVTSLTQLDGDYVITWQSVPDKSYSIITNLSLSIKNPGTAVSGIVAEGSETSYTSSIPAEASVFFEVEVSK